MGSILAGNKPVNAITGLFGDGKRAIDNFTDRAAFEVAVRAKKSKYIKNKYGEDYAAELCGEIMENQRAVGRAIVGGGALAVGGTGLAAGYGAYKALSD